MVLGGFATEGMIMKLPKVLFLDLNKWRCGTNGKNSLGTGPTYLLNQEGYSCCIGQWIQQTNPDLKILNKETPIVVENLKISTLYRCEEHTQFTIDCIRINDDRGTTVKAKIKLLRARIRKSGRTLCVKSTVKL